MLRLRVFAAFFLLSSALPASGQEHVTLKPRFVKGWSNNQEITTETTQNMKVGGSEVTNVLRHTLYFTCSPLDEDKDGNWVVVQRIDRVEVKIQISGSPPMNYDSAKGSAADSPTDKFYESMLGAKFKVTISKDLKVAKIEGRDEFLKKLSGANPQMEQMTQLYASDDGLRDNLLPFLIALPSHPVKVGDFWEQPHVTDLGPIGQLEETRKYSYKGKGEDNLERIQVAVLAKYAKPDPAAVAGLPFKIAKADFKCLDSGGLIKFDNRDGRVASVDTALAMFGVFYIEIGGQETEVELTMLKNTTLKVTGPDLPAPSAAPVDVTPCAQIVLVSCRPCPGLRHRLFQRWRRSR